MEWLLSGIIYVNPARKYRPTHDSLGLQSANLASISPFTSLLKENQAIAAQLSTLGPSMVLTLPVLLSEH